jgi:hypothetical protein
MPRGRPTLPEGVPTHPKYHTSRSGSGIEAHGAMRWNGETKPLQGTGRTKKLAYEAY